MEIQPASLAQVRRARGGQFVAIEDDVANVARDLHALDPSLRLRFSEAGGYFVVYQDLGEGKENIVTTAQELDQRIVKRVEEVMQPSYDYAAELAAQDAKAEADAQERFNEQVGEIGERLFHAARRDKGVIS
jgi:hypothetical protein